MVISSISDCRSDNVFLKLGYPNKKFLFEKNNLAIVSLNKFLFTRRVRTYDHLNKRAPD